MVLWTQRTQFWRTCPKNCPKRGGSLFAQCPETKGKNSSKVWFASKYSFGLVEDSFFNSTFFFSTKRQKFVTQYPKKIRNFSRKNSFASKCSHGNEKTQFQQTSRKFRQKTWSFFPWIYESEKKFFSKKFASEFFYGRSESCFDHPTETFLQKADCFSFIVRKW